MKLLLAVILSCQVALSMSYLQESANIEKDILSGKMNERVMKTADSIILVAAAELKKKGYKDKAELLQFEWSDVNRGLLFEFVYSRDIGDHPNQVLNKWLDEKITMLEFLLGVEFCKNSHISDLKVINATPRIVFRPCTFPMDGVEGERKDEFRRHASRGAIYFGLLPVISYWGVYTSVVLASGGTGYVFVAGIVAELAERMMAQFVTDGLSDKIYKMACGN